MNFSKADLVKNITNKSLVPSSDASKILEFVILLIKRKAISNRVKVSGFGSFSFKKTPKRIGRNPKTGESYIIPALIKLNFKPSNNIKEKIN